jgi:hypothetical protein
MTLELCLSIANGDLHFGEIRASCDSLFFMPNSIDPLRDIGIGLAQGALFLSFDPINTILSSSSESSASTKPRPIGFGLVSHAGFGFLGLESLSDNGKKGLLIDEELLVSSTEVGLIVDSTGEEKPPFGERRTRRCLGERNGDGAFGLFLCWWFALGEGSGDDLFLSILLYSCK